MFSLIVTVTGAMVFSTSCLNMRSVVDGHQTYCVHTTHTNTGQGALCSTGDRQHCVAQGTGSIVWCRGQAALCGAGDRQHCVVQEIGSIVQCRGQAALCSAGDRQPCVVQETGSIV